MHDIWIRMPLALVWAYQGLYCKLLARAPRHAEIAGSAPLLTTIGWTECAISAWILTGLYRTESAAAQTILLTAMNAGGLLRARKLIPDPINMLLQNAVLLTLAWVIA